MLPRHRHITLNDIKSCFNTIVKVIKWGNLRKCKVLSQCSFKQPFLTEDTVMLLRGNNVTSNQHSFPNPTYFTTGEIERYRLKSSGKMKENILKCIDTLKKKHILSDSIFTGIGFGISDLKKSHFPHEVVDKNDFGLLHIQILEQ